MDLVRGNNPSSFIYYLDHGNGNQWYVERDYVSSKEILEAKEGGSGTTPVVVSIACTNAAFDETLSKEELISGPAGTDGAQSVGISMLKSKAGAVVYLGSARPALGMPVYNVDKNGNLALEGTTYGLQMFDTFFEKYRDLQGGRLGDVVVKMYHAFVNENGNDMENERNAYTYFNVALLGDPVLPLPQRKDAEEKTYAFASSTTEFEAAQFGGFPRFLMKEGSALSLSLKAGSKVTATLMKMARGPFTSGEEVVEEKVLSDGDALPVNLNGEDAVGQYFLRLENVEGVPFERQVWFNVAK